MIYKIIELTQQTDEWLDWRKEGIGSTLAGILLGVNPYETLLDAWKEKAGIVEFTPKDNEAIRFGTANEEGARQAYIRKTGEIVEPACLESVDYPFLRTSLDGITKEGDLIVEIKVPKRHNYFSQLKSMPLYYQAQIQHHLLVSGAEVCSYFAWFPDFDGEGFHKNIQREIYPIKEIQDEIVNRSLRFWDCVVSKTEPDMDYFQRFEIEKYLNVKNKS